MLNVPSSSFPAPRSQQRVATVGRSKVPLKPGRSLMDWIRVAKSGQDLTGLRGRLIEVSEEELSKHNTKNDCWMCIRGMVYNISPYMEYHPGGEDELMKAAGADGTDLFNQVHRWVNYESMLKECLVGRMAVKHFPVSKEGTSAELKEKKSLNGTLPQSKVSAVTDRELHPRSDWFQTDSVVTVVIYTKQKNIGSDSIIVDLQENILRGEIIIGDFSYLALIELNHAVEKDIDVRVSEKAGKFEVVLQKKDPIIWKSLGKYLEGHDSYIKSSQRGLYYRKCTLLSKSDVNYNTKLFCFELPKSCYLQVPVGHHVYLKLHIAGVEVVKPYTPVSQCLVLDDQKTPNHYSRYLYIMIKIYPNGCFSPQIDHLAVGDYISISSPQGDFRMSQTGNVEDVFLLSAGTGITPMIQLLGHVLHNVSNLRKVKLIFFNKTEDDILWREQIDKLCVTDKRFEAQFVLSEPSNGWNGYKGHISLQLLSDTIRRSERDSKVLICICGPNGFVDQGIRFLQDLGFSSEEVFPFRE
ncbi:cytochrome b5 reductase 4 [Spea bombifrons]|uniref:cytochrome b5 reductase 4 n=1 Tax=Spea bombifrons TaxID=233779 RepID=UPI002349F60D|nr:cytochrome b5 reductase 4 [Spea bombifrons]